MRTNGLSPRWVIGAFIVGGLLGVFIGFQVGRGEQYADQTATGVLGFVIIAYIAARVFDALIQSVRAYFGRKRG